MSVDIHQLTIHLPPKEQEAVRRAYRDQAQNETAAFLWCFFLGIAGAHHFYLRQWGRGLAHLILVVAAIAALVLGVALALPPALTAGVVVPLLLIALLWMVVDLFRIDDEVSRHNLALAERLTAGAFLADGARGRMALETLAAVEQTEMRAPEPVAVAVTTAQDDRGGAVAEAVVATPESAGVGEGVSAPVAVQVATPEELAAAADAQAADPAPVTVQTVTGIAGIAEGEGYRAVPAGPAGPAADDASATLEPEPSSEAAVAEVTTGAGWSPEAVAGAAAA